MIPPTPLLLRFGPLLLPTPLLLRFGPLLLPTPLLLRFGLLLLPTPTASSPPSRFLLLLLLRSSPLSSMNPNARRMQPARAWNPAMMLMEVLSEVAPSKYGPAKPPIATKEFLFSNESGGCRRARCMRKLWMSFCSFLSVAAPKHSLSLLSLSLLSPYLSLSSLFLPLSLSLSLSLPPFSHQNAYSAHRCLPVT